MATSAPSAPAKATTGAAAEAPAVVTVNHVVGSKAQIAQAIFDEDARAKPRKEVIGRMRTEAGLTEAGASTYYQNMKKTAGMVKPRVLVTTEVQQGGTAPSPTVAVVPPVKETTTA